MSEPTVSRTTLSDLIEQVAGIIDSDRTVSNKELIQFCAGCGAFDLNADAHIYHEIAETALNLLILKKYGRDLLASMNPIEELSTVLRPLQKRLPTQTWRSETQIAYQQFSTPVTIAFLATYLLHIRHSETVLEPSCGTGCLAVWALAAGAKVIANEIDPRRRAAASALGFQSYELDAEFIDEPRRVREQLTDPRTALTMPSKFEQRRRHRFRLLLVRHACEPLITDHRGGNLLPVLPLQARLVIKQVEL